MSRYVEEISREAKDTNRVPTDMGRTESQRRCIPFASFFMRKALIREAENRNSPEWVDRFERAMDSGRYSNGVWCEYVMDTVRICEFMLALDQEKHGQANAEDMINVIEKTCDNYALLCAAHWTADDPRYTDNLGDRDFKALRLGVMDKDDLDRSADEYWKEQSSREARRQRDREIDRRSERGGRDDRSERGGWRESGRRGSVSANDIARDARGDARSRSRDDDRSGRESKDSYASYKSDRRGPNGQYSHYGHNLNHYVNDRPCVEATVGMSRMEAAMASTGAARSHAGGNSSRFSQFDPENYDHRSNENTTRPPESQARGYDESHHDMSTVSTAPKGSMREQFRADREDVMGKINVNYDKSVNSFDDLQEQQETQQAQVKSQTIDERLARAQAELDEESKNDVATRLGVRRMAYKLGDWIYKEPPILAPTMGTEMDQAEHGAIYAATADLERKPLTNEVKRLTTLAIAAFANTVTPEDLQEHIDEDPSNYLVDNDSALILVSSAESTRKAVAVAKEKGLDARRIHRTKITVKSVLILREQAKQLQDHLAKVQNLTQAQAMLIAAVRASETKGTAESPQISDMRGAVEFVNKNITDDLNDYLIDVMGVGTREDPLFTNFMEDFEGAKKLIADNLGSQASSTFGAFCNDYMCALNKALNDKNLAVVKSVRDDLELDEEVGVIVWPKLTLTTNVPFTMAELGYGDLKGSTTVSSKVTPFIDSLIIKSREELNERYGNEYISQALVFRCGSLLRIFQSPNRANAYVLARSTRR